MKTILEMARENIKLDTNPSLFTLPELELAKAEIYFDDVKKYMKYAKNHPEAEQEFLQFAKEAEQKVVIHSKNSLRLSLGDKFIEELIIQTQHNDTYTT